MGIYADQEIERKAARKGRQKDKEARNASRRALRGTQERASWAEATPAVLASLIHQETERGHGVLFGVTRDGGALVLTIYCDGQATKEYFRPSDDLDTILLGYMSDAGYIGQEQPQDALTSPQEAQQRLL